MGLDALLVVVMLDSLPSRRYTLPEPGARVLDELKHLRKRLSVAQQRKPITVVGSHVQIVDGCDCGEAIVNKLPNETKRLDLVSATIDNGLSVQRPVIPEKSGTDPDTTPL